MSNRDIAAEVTEKILAELDKGTVPWRRPWTRSANGDYGQRNLQSKKPYRGINQFLTEITAATAGYPDPYWTTFRAAKKAGGQVRKGEKGTLVVFWKRIRIKEKDPATGKTTVKMIPLLRHYVVFNVAQCDGLAVPSTDPIDVPDPVPTIDAGEAIIAGMDDCPPISHGGDRAFYSPIADRIQLPNRDDFVTAAAYYGTALHEIVHATGHSSRLDRKLDSRLAPFGSPDYSKEELIAELGASMLCGSAGIDPDFPQSAAYIDSWRRKLRGDKKLILTAAAKAQRAMDYVLGVKFPDAD